MVDWLPNRAFVRHSEHGRCCRGGCCRWNLNGRKTESPPPPEQTQDISVLVRQMTEVTEQARVELKRSREQNEKLAQLLQQAQEELVRLRRELRDVRPATVAETAGLNGAACGQGSPARRRQR